jgi:hypothetical protein
MVVKWKSNYGTSLYNWPLTDVLWKWKLICWTVQVMMLFYFILFYNLHFQLNSVNKLIYQTQKNPSKAA